MLGILPSMDLSHLEIKVALFLKLVEQKGVIYMAKTISMSVGRVAIMHDIRAEYSANVDKTLSHQNAIFVDKLKDFNYDIEAYTNARFQNAINEYNEKQARESRRKTKTYTQLIAEENEKLIAKSMYNKEHGINSSIRKPTKLVHEYVLQIGDRNSNGTLTADIDKNKEYLQAVLEELQKKYPHMEILLATFHADEPNGTPHLHILVQFVGDGYKQGLFEQISISKALEQDGFERSQNRGDYAINRFIEDIKDSIMTDKLLDIMNEERDIIGEHRPHEDIRIFRERAKQEEKALQEKRKELKSHVDSQMAHLNNIYDKLVKQRDKLDTESNELAIKREQFEKDKDMLVKKEIQLESFSDRTSDMFNEALSLLNKSKKIYKALSQEQQALYNKSLVTLNEQLMPHSRKTNDRQYSL